MRRLLLVVAVLVAGLFGPARAEERIALVIGNADYDHIGRLANSVSDAELIASTLEGLGFEVTLLRDAGLGDLKRAIATFGRRLREAGPKTTGLFYYAGHGVQSFGTNYLLPVDTALTDAADLPLVALEAETVLRQMYSARNRTNIVILDACRNNPFENVSSFTDDGLAEMKAPTGTFLAYATSPGSVAYDGENGNSPFSSALADAMMTPGLLIEQAFKQVRVAVLAETDGKQTPWDTSSLTADFAFLAQAPKPAAAPPDSELDLWQSVRATRDPVQIALFLRAYPNSRFLAEAQALLIEVTTGKGPVEPPAAPAPRNPDEREQALIASAQSEGTVEAYKAYLDAFPDGVFADLARIEIAALAAKAGKDPAGTGVTPEKPETVAEAPPPAANGAVTFHSPISDPGGPVDGKSLAELIEGSPVFPPIEGLPDEIWKNHECSSCHQWDSAKLCEQAKTYVTRGATGVERLQHPYGLGFKRALASWAAQGCPES